MSISSAKLEFWAKHDYNVCLSGRHGVGKTAQVVQLFNDLYGEQGKDWLYFSASTMDPWVDFIGVPKEATAEDGVNYLHLVRPEVFARDQVKAIFLDEYNRAHKKIRNAVMELIQFHSINGHKFHNLKVVWTAINPSEDSEDSEDHLSYDVDELDPAQLDRFHVHVEVPYTVSSPYFKSKYGDDGVAAVEWWNGLKKEIKDIVSPRRLDYAVDCFIKGGDMRDILPKGVNTSQLSFMLSQGSIKGTLNDLLDAKDEKATREKLQDDNFYNLAIDVIAKSPKFMRYFMPLVPDEKLSQFISSSSKSKIDKMLAATKKSKKLAEKVADIVTVGGIADAKLKQLSAWLKEYFPDLFPDASVIGDLDELLDEAKRLMKSNIDSTYNRINHTKELMECITTLPDNVTITSAQAKAANNWMLYFVGRSNKVTFEKVKDEWCHTMGRLNSMQPFKKHYTKNAPLNKRVLEDKIPDLFGYTLEYILSDEDEDELIRTWTF